MRTFNPSWLKAVLLSGSILFAQSPRKTGPPSAAVKEMLAYRLTNAGFERYTAASRGINALLLKDRGILRKLQPTPKDAPDSIDATVNYTRQRCPECIATVEKNMPYREYVIFQGSLLISYIYAIRPRAASLVRPTPENIQYILANRAKIDAILAEQRLQPGAAAR